MKVKNTILQSAFFALANIMPKDDAITYMKEKATKSYSKFGDEVVAQNHKAIELGAGALVHVDVPADWAEAGQTPAEPAAVGKRAEVVDFVNRIVRPISKMDGDSLPVSAFVGMEDGTVPAGRSCI